MFSIRRGYNNTALLGFSLSLLLFTNLLLITLPASADVKSMMPDFYAEPGLNPFRDPLSANVNEVIDPFSGGLRLTHTDLVVPGNGGFDIKIQRSYNSNNVYLSRKTPTNLAPNLTTLLPRSPVGMGWTLHFGRVLKAEDASGVANVCDIGTIRGDTLSDAILELPDGSVQILYVNATPYSTRFITHEQWTADCITGGLLVTSPDGMKYTMTKQVAGGSMYSTSLDHAWYATHIQDRNGNYIDLTYLTLASNKNALVSRITASDGRVVDFNYSNSTDSTNVLLSSITANGQTWQYQYTADATGGGNYQLISVTRPDGLAWNYQYYNRSAGQAGNKILQRVTYPYGATVNYDYGYVCFMGVGVSCSVVYDTFYSLVVTTKTNGGRGITPGTWTYSYAPSTTEDVTTVTFPGGRYVYKHFGSQLMFGGSTIPGKTLWKIGLLKEQQTYNGSTLVNDVIYTWDAPYVLSNQLYVRPPYDGSDPNHAQYADAAVYMPVLLRKDVIRDGTTYTTTYSNFNTADGSFNPRTITETGQATRTTNLTYFPRTAGQNIVRLVKDEVLSGESAGKSITRTFDAQGNPTQIVRHGVPENYSYYATGDLFRKTNARNFAWTYNNYVRGIPTSETQPGNITISRTVNATGTIAKETNGRGYSTSYTYDGLNRLTSISRPLGTSVSIAWNPTDRTVKRGAYTQTTSLEGFGRPSAINTGGITQTISYNALGYKSFQSYYSSSNGDSYTTDVLGRVTSITHGDGTTQVMQYLSGNTVNATNERNYVTQLNYRSFGDPDNGQDKVLLNISAPEGITTAFARNILGQPTTITQGGITRTYGYDSTNNFLTSLTQPETGTTTFGRDAVGNMTSRRVGSSGTTTYTYDGLNRLTNIAYPSPTPNVTQAYDPNSNVTLIDNGVAKRDLVYDANDNLTTETLTTGSNVLGVTYTYNALDYLSYLTYPSLRQVGYTPDALGRPTTAVPYVNAVTYWPNGVPSQLQYANGQLTTTTLNPRQWIASITTQKSGVGYAEDLAYVYDGRANVTSIINTLDSTDSKSLAYDGVDRLISAGTASASYDTADNLTALRTGSGNLSYAYTSNRLTSLSGARTASLSYDTYGNVTNNGPNTFVYDDAANLRSVGGATTATYDYDGQNHRLRVTHNGLSTLAFYTHAGQLLGEYAPTGAWQKEYTYLGDKLVTLAVNPDTDHDGLPDSQDNCTQVYNPDQRDTDHDGYGNLCDADLNNDGATNTLDLNLFKLAFGSKVGDPNFTPDADLNGDGLINSLDLGLFKLLYNKPPGPSNVPTPEQLTYYHLDALGSPVAGTDAQGNVTWKETYQPYGERIQKSPAATDNPRWYTGHPQDTETGLVYAGARYYDPVVGRFMATDSKEYREGDVHSFNRYGYGNNNPYKYVDPDGEDAISVGVSINLIKIPIKGLPLGGSLAGSIGFTISLDGFTGGEFDIGVYRTGSGGYEFSPETSIKGIGKLTADLTVSKGSVIDMEGESTQHSVTVGLIGLHAGRKDGQVDSVGVHGGGGFEISSGGAKTEVYSARRGIQRAAEAAIDAGARFLSRTVKKRADDLFGTPPIK